MWWMWPLLAAIALGSVAVAAIIFTRRRQQAPAPYAQYGTAAQARSAPPPSFDVTAASEEIPQADYDLETEAARDAQTDGAIESLDMEQGAPEVLEMEDMAQPEFGRVGAVPPHIAASVQTPQEHAAAYQVPISSVGAVGASVGASSISPSVPSPGTRYPQPSALRHIRCPRCKNRIPIYKEGPQQISCPACGKTGPYTPKGVGTLASANLPVPPPEQADTYAAPQVVEAPEEVYAPTFAPAYSAPQQARPQGRAPVRVTRCSNCGSQVPIFTTVYPVRISCPSCGRSGMYKGPRTQ
jgi:ribosomal protein S27E